MKNPTSHLPHLLGKWRKAAWPLLTGRQEPIPPKREAEQTAAKQEWEDEGGAVKPTIAPVPKLPL